MAIEIDRSGLASLVPVAGDTPQNSSILAISIAMAIVTFAALQISIKVTIVRITSFCNAFQ
jgi:hypothetical protein